MNIYILCPAHRNIFRKPCYRTKAHCPKSECVELQTSWRYFSRKTFSRLDLRYWREARPRLILWSSLFQWGAIFGF